MFTTGAITNNWQLKLIALAVAFLLWLGIQSGRPYRYRMAHVPVRVINHDPEWVIAGDVVPATVAIDFRGSFRDLMELAKAGVAIEIPVDDVTGGSAVYSLRSSWVNLGSASRSIVIRAIRPDSVHLSFDRIATRLVTVRAVLEGDLPAGLELSGAPVLDPGIVRVSGPARRLARMDTLDLRPIDLGSLRQTETMEVMIDTTGLGVTVSPRRVRVALPVRAATRSVPK
jgi:YbbR domain-containing protein